MRSFRCSLENIEILIYFDFPLKKSNGILFLKTVSRILLALLPLLYCTVQCAKFLYGVGDAPAGSLLARTLLSRSSIIWIVIAFCGLLIFLLILLISWNWIWIWIYPNWLNNYIQPYRINNNFILIKHFN